MQHEQPAAAIERLVRELKGTKMTHTTTPAFMATLQTERLEMAIHNATAADRAHRKSETLMRERGMCQVDAWGQSRDDLQAAMEELRRANEVFA